MTVATVVVAATAAAVVVATGVGLFVTSAAVWNSVVRRMDRRQSSLLLQSNDKNVSVGTSSGACRSIRCFRNDEVSWTVILIDSNTYYF